MEDFAVGGVFRVSKSSAVVRFSLLASVKTHRAAVRRERRQVDGGGGGGGGGGLVLVGKWWLA